MSRVRRTAALKSQRRIFALQEEKIEGVVDQRHVLLRAFEYLKQLEGRPSFFVERGNFAVEH